MSGTILIVDDDPSIRSNTAELLELDGHTCITFADGASALAWCTAHPGEAALALLDLSMPGLSGTQTFRRLRDMDPSLPVIIASGSADVEVLHGLLAQGLTAVLSKPARGRDILATVAKAMGRS